MIPEPDSIVFNVSGSSDELCLGACDGEIFLNSLSGGWSSSNYLALLTDNNTGITHTLPVLNNTISNVCSGDYTVSISNDDGCFSSFINNNHAVVGIVNSQLPAPVIAVTDDASCYQSNDGAIALVGSPNLLWTYVWYDINGIQVGTGNGANSLSAGEYYVEASFNNNTNCTSVSLPVIITEPDSILISEVSHIDVTCNGGNDGEIDISVSGGISSYSYLWSNGSISQDISSLVSGSYTCTVTDGNNCTQTASFNISEPSSLSASIVPESSEYLCFNS